MPQRRLNGRALARIRNKGQARAEEIALYVVRQIQILAPFDTRVTNDTKGPHLRNSYYTRVDGKGGIVIKCKRRYWVFVEFGTQEHGRAQPHVRPALDMARERYRL